MSRLRRVAVTINLDWPVAHHHHIFAGIQRYSQECGRWECSVNPYVDFSAARGAGGVDGIIARATPQVTAEAGRAGIPVVNVWLNTPVKDLPSVLPDLAESGRMAARHLLARGFRTFGYLGRRQELGSRLQLAGFREVLGQYGCDCSACWISVKYDDTSLHWRQFQQCLARWIDGWTPPVGVLVVHDSLCRYLAEMCRGRGLKVPSQAALVSAANEAILCMHPAPSLTSIDFGFEQVGYRAAELLDALMDGSPPPAEPILVPPRGLYPRQSSDAFAVDDPLAAAALRFLAEHAHEHIGVDDVAAHVSLTRRTLSRLFQAVLGRTVHDVLVHLRVERAKRLLLEPGAMVKSVAAQCGFRDAIHLGKVFQRIEGILPSKYREAYTLQGTGRCGPRGGRAHFVNTRSSREARGSDVPGTGAPGETRWT